MSEVLCKLSWMRGHGVFWNWDGQGRAGARADGRGGCQETVNSGYPAGKGGRMNRGSPSEPAVRQRPPTNLLVRLPRLRPPSSALDSRRIRFDDEFWERVLPLDARMHLQVSRRHRVRRMLLCKGYAAVIGVTNRVNAILGSSTTLVPADVRPTFIESAHRRTAVDGSTESPVEPPSGFGLARKLRPREHTRTVRDAPPVEPERLHHAVAVDGVVCE